MMPLPRSTRIVRSVEALIEMLATWHAGAPNEKEPFSMILQLVIKQELFGVNAASVRIINCSPYLPLVTPVN